MDTFLIVLGIVLCFWALGNILYIRNSPSPTFTFIFTLVLVALGTTSIIFGAN